jgi:hypothetical protein
MADTADQPAARLAPLAFIYDRHTTPQRAMLDLRVDACREYAALVGYEVANAWIDEGDGALDDADRPQFAVLLKQLGAAVRDGRIALCLVNNWDRLASDGVRCVAFQSRIRARGGWTATALGEDDVPRPARRGTIEDLLLSARIAQVNL